MGRGQNLLNLVKSIKQEKELQTVQEEIKEVIKPENLKAGVTAFGVEGNKNIVDTSDGNLYDYYLHPSYTGYSKGSKIKGRMPLSTVDNPYYFHSTQTLLNPETPNFILIEHFSSGTVKGKTETISASAVNPEWIENKNICIRANHNPSLTYWKYDWRVEIAVCEKKCQFKFKNSNSEQPIYCVYRDTGAGAPYTLYHAWCNNLSELTIDSWTKTDVAVSSYMNTALGKIGTLYAYSRDVSVKTTGLTGSSGIMTSEGKIYFKNELDLNASQAFLPNGTGGFIGIIDENAMANFINLKSENIRKGETYLGVEGTMEAGIDTSDATAVAGDLAKGKIAYVNGEKVVGTVDEVSNSLTFSGTWWNKVGANDTVLWTDSQAVNKDWLLRNGAYVQTQVSLDKVATALKITPEKIVEGNTISGIAGTAKLGIDTSDATATAEDIVINKTAYVNGKKVVGTLSRSYGSSSVVFSDGIEVVDGLTLRFKKKFDEPEMFPKNSYFSLQADIDSLLSAIGLTADKIKAGETILGITGTYTGENSNGVGHTGGEN